MQRLIFLLICAVTIVYPTLAQDEPDTESPQQTLTVWLPAPIISDFEREAYQQLLAHSNQFAVEQNVTIEYRIKAIGQMGGIMSTIRSASVVAPGALPDVTLVRRSDLVSVQATIYLQSLESLFSSVLLNDLDISLKLGQVVHNESLELFGLPYFIDIQLAVTNEVINENTPNLTFADILESANTFLFPAGRNNGLNQTFYLQYLAAGGVPARNGEMNINVNALQTVLEFYESAVERNIVSSPVLEYNSPSAYRTEYLNMRESTNIAIFSSSEFMSLLQQDSDLQATTIPTESGDTITTIDGWLWVMVTPEPSQQNLSVQYLNWMMSTDFHAAFASELNRLPSQQLAIRESLPSNVDLVFIDNLLNNTYLPLPESEGGTVPRAMQEALAKVINGYATAEQATRDIIDEFNLD